MATVSVGSKKTAKQSSSVCISLPKRKRVILGIVSTSPMIQHRWSEKAKEMIRNKQQTGDKKKNRDIRVPEDECEAATYRTSDGRYGIPLLSIKAAIVSAAHKDLGIEKTLVRKSIFMPDILSDGVLPIYCDDPIMREDMVRVGMGSADLRYRPEFKNWSAELTFEIDAELMTTENLLALIERAGFSVGICEWRPEKGGEFGRFCVDRTVPLQEEMI